MAKKEQNPYNELKRIFHAPSRLSIVSFLSGAKRGLSFGDLKKMSQLSDGNLSRQLKNLENEKIISIKKEFVDGKPRTTVSITKKGKIDFIEYLEALEKVLITANTQIEGKEESNIIFDNNLTPADSTEK